jgi:hypothetical protein
LFPGGWKQEERGQPAAAAAAAAKGTSGSKAAEVTFQDQLERPHVRLRHRQAWIKAGRARLKHSGQGPTL